MAVSGTTTFAPNFTEIAEEAYERCEKELRSGYDLRTARRSLNLLTIEWANQGINFWALEEGTISLVAGTATYDLPADTVDILEHAIRTNSGSETLQNDLAIPRISASTYSTIPNKLTQGLPIQVMVNREREIPSVTLWPIPDDAQTYTFVYWRMRRLQDIGTGVNTPDIPFRFYPALMAGLAYYVGLKIPGMPTEKMVLLKTEYDRQFMLATDEDRDRAPQRWVPARQTVGGR
jgi:hypothetical protein